MKTDMEYCLAQPNRPDRIDRVLAHFSLSSPEEAGLHLADLAALQRRAEVCLEQFQPEAPAAAYRTHMAVRLLGREKPARSPGDANTARSLTQAARQLAYTLSAYREDIALQVVSRADRSGEISTKFVICSEADSAEPMRAMIRSAFGRVELEPLPSVPEYPICFYAQGEKIASGKKKENAENAENDGTRDPIPSWAAAVLASLPQRGNYTVCMRFVPLEQPERFRAQIDQLNALHHQLQFYTSLTWGNSVGLNTGFNEGQNMLQSTLGTNSNSYGSNYGLSLSGKNEYAGPALTASQLEQEIQRLYQGLHGAWGIQLSVSVDDIATLQAVTSVVTGTVQAAGFRLRWQPAPSRKVIWATSQEILPLLSFPTRPFCGFSLVENEDFSLTSQGSCEAGFQLGSILWNGTPFSPFWLSESALKRHLFLCGMTGAGKTNTIFRIMEGAQLPFCVIEPVKGEYRALKSIYPDLKVWTMKVTDQRDSSVKIMQINPFWFPREGNLAYHIDSLKTIIASSFELTAAMPNILEQCLYSVYVKAGWDLVTNRNIYWDMVPESYLYPTFTDLLGEVETYLDQSDFSGETLGDYKGALLSRLKSFVNGYKGILLNTTEHPDYELLMHGHSVLELEGLADDADKCLVMGTILIQYYQYLKLHFQSPGSGERLGHLLVIEEAHRLFKNTSTDKRADGAPNPTGQLVDLLSNMMAEIRAFGECMMIVDQSPTKLAEDVIKNSATKIVHRIDNGNDIKMMQSAMLLPEDILSFASLAQGEALIRTDRMAKPCKVKIFCSDVKECYDLSASFRPASFLSCPLADLFLATSLLSDGCIAAQIQAKLIVYFDNLAAFGTDGWYALTGDLICAVLDILRAHNQLDAVSYKLSVLAELLSLALPRMLAGRSKKELGFAHMLLTRLLDFFQDQRSGVYIKSGTAALFDSYCQAHILPLLLTYHTKHVSEAEHALLCRVAGLPPEALFSHILTDFLHGAMLTAITEEEPLPEPEELLGCFLEQHVLPHMRQNVLEQYEGVFCTLHTCAKQLVGEGNADV